MTRALLRSEFAGTLTGACVGSGPTLVLIHGVGLRAEAWGPMLPTLAQQFTVYALDMPGHGRSPQITKPGLAAFTARFAAFLAALDAPACVAGHSMGALIALDLACRFSDHVQAVAALNAIYRRTDAAAKAVQARALELSLNSQPDPTATLNRWFGPHPTAALARTATDCRSWLTTCDPAGYSAAYQVFAHDPGPDPQALAALRCPALFLTGADERNSTPAMSQAMAAICPNGTARIVNDAAHMAPMTHADEIAHDLIRFFQPARGQS